MRFRAPAVLVAALAFAASPNAARALDPGYKDFGTLCLAGSLVTCASVSVKTTTVYVGGVAAYTQVEIKVANMQGTDATDNTGGSLVTQIGITAPDIQGASNLTVSGPVGGGSPAGYWSINDKPVGGQVELAASIGNIEGGILGCDYAEAGPNQPTNYFQTCETGVVTFTFQTTTIWSAADAEVVFGVRSVDLDGGSYQCRTEDETGEHACGPSTIPEPVTTTLLATGLAGFGYLQRRRRRTEGAEIEG